jgi:homoserine acetyltransferase
MAPGTVFDITTLVVIGTDGIGSCKSPTSNCSTYDIDHDGSCEISDIIVVVGCIALTTNIYY